MTQFVWEQTGNLGTLITGEVSEFKVQLSTSTYNLSYKTNSGILPPNLELNRDGTISGIAASNTASTSTIYNFTVAAVDVYGTTSTTTSVSITVNQNTSTEFTRIYARPFLHPTVRKEFADFINDPLIIDPESIYRPLDPNFGLQSSMKLFLSFGVEKLSATEYYSILSRNFYKRKFVLGPPQFAQSIEPGNQIKYEVVYVEVLDKYSLNSQTIPSEIVINSKTYYPAGIANMRERISSQADTTDLLDPKFMRIRNPDSTISKKFMKVIPLCYVLPGKGKGIVKKIKASGFKFNMIDFEIDRLVVESSIGNNGAKYLLLNKNYPLV